MQPRYQIRVLVSYTHFPLIFNRYWLFEALNSLLLRDFVLHLNACE
jgi:hypothetical protein